MAGGDTASKLAPYPKYPGLVMLTFGPVDLVTNKTKDHLFEKQTTRFAFRPVAAELTAYLVTLTSGTVTINLEDDSTSAKVIIDDVSVAAVVAGAATTVDVTVDNTLVIFAGAILEASYGTGATVVGTGLKLQLWVEPRD